MITKLIRKPPWFKVWSAITAIALVVALVLTFLPYHVDIGTGGILSISLRQTSANPSFTARTETYFDAASLDSPYDATVDKPTGTAEGDILFVLVCWYSASTIDSVPSGWALVTDGVTTAEYLDNGDKYALYYKVAGASEPDTYIWSFSGSQRTRLVCSCYTGGDFKASDPIDVVSNTGYRTENNSVIAASMGVSVTNSPLVFWAGVRTGTIRTFTKPSVPTNDWVEDDDAGSTDSDFSIEVCSMIWSGSGATGAMTATVSYINDEKHAFAVALNPAAAVVAPTVTTQAGSAIHCSNFTANGNITDTGGENCTTRGFCYMVGDSGDPTTANSTVYDNGAGSYGTGAYSKVISSLTCGTSYRVRAYAINSAGTGYGTSVTVTTGEPGISSEPDEYDFGIVAVAGTAVTGLDYFTITNTGNCTVDVTIQGTDATNMTGGTLYEYYDTGDDGIYGFYGVIWKAQTFTTTSGAHSIGSVSLKLYRVGSPDTITASIRAVDGSSHPTGGDLCSGTTDGDTLTTDSGGEWRTIAFNTAYALSASTMYAIVARATGGDALNQVYWRRDTTSPTYIGGALETSADSGSSWGTTSGSDYMFREYSVYTWDLADGGSPGENTYALKAGLYGGDYTTVVNTTANSLVTNLAESATQDWGLKIYMPTALSGYDNQEMTATVTLVASEAA